MRVFLDTNVVISGTAARGLCADVMREVLLRHELVVCEELLGEIEAVLLGKLEVPVDAVADLISLLREGAIAAEPAPRAELPLRDEMDRTLVSAALNGKAEVFVTGDVELLSVRESGDMAIVSPRAFWERAKAQLQARTPR